MTQSGSILVTGIGEMATPTGFSARCGVQMKDLRIERGCSILVKDGIIEYAGPEAGLPAGAGIGITVLDAQGRPAIPGFVDSHTHFIFGGYRAEEFYWRAAGIPYMEIHRLGGGIARSVEATRNASFDALMESGRRRLQTMTELGITTVEGKSGYGLDLHTETRQLAVMAKLAQDPAVAQEIVPTFLGPHSVPSEYKGEPGRYIDFVLETVLPEIRRLGLAEFCDIFCEKGVFGLEDSARYLEAARASGFKLKLHADEIERIGGAGLAARMKATSADHLLKATSQDLAAMARAGVIATCLPLTALTLREPYANARAMIDEGLAVALASDLNPGSCHSQSIPLIQGLAVLGMGLSPEEALTALTLNGAAALDRAQYTGSLEAKKRGDILILDAPSWNHMAYTVGMNLVAVTIARGRVVSGRV